MIVVRTSTPSSPPTVTAVPGRKQPPRLRNFRRTPETFGSVRGNAGKNVNRLQFNGSVEQAQSNVDNPEFPERQLYWRIPGVNSIWFSFFFFSENTNKFESAFAVR